MPVVVAEDDPIIRNVQVALDPDAPEDRRAAIADYFSVDLPDFSGWCDELRARAPNAWPSEFRMIGAEEAFAPALGAADAVIVEGFRVGEEALAAAPRLKVVHKFGVDLRNVDLAACARRKVAVRPLRRRVNAAVAEHAFALMLALAKRICLLDGRIDTASLERAGFAPKLYDRRHCGASNWGRVGGLGTLEGATLGALGLGEIGREVARRAAAFGMEVLYHQRRRLPEEVERAHAAAYCGFEELLERADYLTIHVPATPQTRNMIDRAALARMKPGACLVNVSRASVIDRGALVDALEAGRLGGAGLDVFWEEPAAPGDRLAALPNVVATPHTAVASRWNGARDVEELVLGLDEALGREPA